MNRRFASVLVGLAALLVACSSQSAQSDGPETDTEPPDELAVSEILESVNGSTENNEPLDSFCRRVYGDAEFSPDVTVGLVADVASIDDGTFNQAAFEGMEAAGRCFGVETTFLESAGDDSADQIASLVDRNVDIVVTVGFQFQEATLAAAQARPDVQFIGVDHTNPDQLSNYLAIAFRDDQVGYIAGAMAALISESGTVAVIAGPDSIPPVVAIADGFEAGAKHVSPDITILRHHLDSFIDAPAGANQAATFVEAGADVIFGAAGKSGASAITAAAASGAMVIGVDQDEYFTTFGGGIVASSDGLVTSAIKRVDLGVFLSIAAMTNGQVPEDGALLLDATNGGVTYAPFHQAQISEEVAAELEQIRLDLAADNRDVRLAE